MQIKIPAYLKGFQTFSFVLGAFHSHISILALLVKCRSGNLLKVSKVEGFGEGFTAVFARWEGLTLHWQMTLYVIMNWMRVSMVHICCAVELLQDPLIDFHIKCSRQLEKLAQGEATKKEIGSFLFARGEVTYESFFAHILHDMDIRCFGRATLMFVLALCILL